MTNYAPPAPASTGAGRPRTALWLAVVVVVGIVAFVLGRWVLPAESGEGADGTRTAPTSTATPGEVALNAPHGPKTFTKNVPSGYTRDKAGAATAAVNAIQVQVAVAHGKADPETVKQTWIASNADQQTREALSEGPNTSGDDQTNKLPVTTRVTEFSDSAATVEIWVVSVGSTSGIGGGTLTAARWSTATYRLAWEGDWKVVSLKSVSGPQPGETSNGAPLPPLTNGLYTFYTE